MIKSIQTLTLCAALLLVSDVSVAGDLDAPSELNGYNNVALIDQRGSHHEASIMQSGSKIRLSVSTWQPQSGAHRANRCR